MAKLWEGKLGSFCPKGGTLYISLTTLFEIFNFCPKIQLWFPEKMVNFLGVKNSRKCCGFGIFCCWQLWFHEKNCQKNLGEKLVKMLGFCQNWIFVQKFDFSNSMCTYLDVVLCLLEITTFSWPSDYWFPNHIFQSNLGKLPIRKPWFHFSMIKEMKSEMKKKTFCERSELQNKLNSPKIFEFSRQNNVTNFSNMWILPPKIANVDSNIDFCRENSNIFNLKNEWSSLRSQCWKKRLIQRLREYFKKCCV